MKDTFPTVKGYVNIDNSGYILPHDHQLYFPQNQDKSTYKETYDHFVPIYKELVEKYNCRTVVDVCPKLACKPWVDSGIQAEQKKLGSENRTNFELLRDISRDSGMNIVLATGYYLKETRPDNFKYRTAADIANEFINDLTDGINGSDVRARIIKVALSHMDSEDCKLLSAAAIAQKETSASITTHTTSPEVRIFTLNFLEGADVDPGRIYLGHADCYGDIMESFSLVRRGCNLIYTGWGITHGVTLYDPTPRHYSSYLLLALVDEGYVDKVLFSIDYAAEYTDGKLKGLLYEMPERTSFYAFTYVVPRLKQIGVSQECIDKIMLDNPRKMLKWERP